MKLKQIRKIATWLLAARKKPVVIGIVAVVTAFWSTILIANTITDGRVFDTLFFWTREQNQLPAIDRIFATQFSQPVEAKIESGRRIFLQVDATDKEGDPITYFWVHPTEGGFFEESEDSDLYGREQHIVRYLPPSKPGVYVVGVRVSNMSRADFTLGEIEVEVVP